MKPKYRFKTILLTGFLVFCACAASRADTVYLKNGRSLDGIIKKEDEKGVELDMGAGLIVVSKSDINRISRSGAEEAKEIKQKLETQGIDLEKRREESSEARDKRFAEFNKWQEEERQNALSQTSESKEIQAARGQSPDSILVEAVINNKVKAVLILDTGASLVILSKKIGAELGIDLTDTKREIIELKMADNRKIRAKTTVLKSLNVQGAEEKDVLAAVLLDEAPTIGLHSGLLGMSYLGRFNVAIDRRNMKVTMEKISAKK